MSYSDGFVAGAWHAALMFVIGAVVAVAGSVALFWALRRYGSR